MSAFKEAGSRLRRIQTQKYNYLRKQSVDLATSASMKRMISQAQTTSRTNLLTRTIKA
jgi:hypothetical protein